MKTPSKKLVVIGGGAAGFFCAVNAARLCPGLQVTIVEKSSKVLQKVKVSGGGRCNVTHAQSSVSSMARCYPRGEKFVSKLFQHFFVPHTVAWFAERGVALKTEADGRMFPESNSSEDIMACLLKEANKYGVLLLLNYAVQSLQKQPDGFAINSVSGRTLTADAVCIATGGFSKSEMYDWMLAATGHTIEPPVPSLFTFNAPQHPITQLMGVATAAKVKVAGLKYESEGPLLITHWGLSGPAVLRLSAFAAKILHLQQYAATVTINWLPAYNETSLRETLLAYRNKNGSQQVANTSFVNIPGRLWHFLLSQSHINPQMKWADVPAAAQNSLIKNVCSYQIQIAGKTTFKEEFVTAGGIVTSEISSNTMQSKLLPGIWFAGEIINVDGITGGYNFQHAWSSGYVAACSIADVLKEMVI